MNINDLLRSFPKKRTQLPSQFEAIYIEQYKENRGGCSIASGLSQKMESWMHKKVAEDVIPGPQKSTLEIGAGTLNHLSYEPQAVVYDIVEPFSDLYQSSPNLNRVRNVYSNIAQIPNGVRYERITSIATFEHICNLPEVVAKAAMLLADGGELRVGIPSEGTLLWYLGWKLTTGFEFKLKYNLDYKILMRHEHVNTASEIKSILRYFFRHVKGSVFGLSKSLSFYQFYKCSGPRFDKCSHYVKET
jgi:hypothetical protein